MSMGIQPAIEQIFAVCVLSAAVESVAGESVSGVRTVCGLAVALTVLRLGLAILK